MTPEQRRAILIAASNAAPPSAAPSAPPMAVAPPAPNPSTGLYGAPPTGHPLSANPAQPIPVAGQQQPQGPRPGRPAGMAPGTAKGTMGGATVAFVDPNGGHPDVSGAPVVRTRGAGRVVSGPSTGASVTMEGNATRRSGAQPQIPGQVVMQGHAPTGAGTPGPTAMQWMGGQTFPQSMPTAATTQIADLTIMLSQHTRPGFLERQRRTLETSTMRAASLACFVNPVQGVQINDALLAGISKLRADRDMGPWMRWRFATEISTHYTLILDDDCIFGPRWLQRAMERIMYSESQGQRIVVAAGGIVYRSDTWNDTFPIGPESPPPEERVVDVGRGAWLFPTELLDLFFGYPRLGSRMLTIPLHFAAAMQEEGIPTITLTYPLDDRAAWGMSAPPSPDGSMSKMLDSLAVAQRGNSAAWHREEAYLCYRAAGWKPLCVLASEQETVRLEAQSYAPDLGAPPPVVAPPEPAPSSAAPSA